MTKVNSIFSMFDTNKNEEQDGVWADYGDVRILLAHAGGANTEFGKVLQKMSKPYLKLIKNGTLDESISKNIEMSVYLETIIKSIQVKLEGEWQEGVPTREGGIDPYTPENVKQFLYELPHFYADIKEFSGNHGNYRVDSEEVKGN